MKYLNKRKEIDASIIEKLESATGLRHEVAEILAMRGIDDEIKAQEFLHPFIHNLTPYANYSGMEEAAERIKEAIEFGQKIVIYGDYDCDGISATSILYLYLKNFDIEVEYYIPVRKKDGYGVTQSAIEEIAEDLAPDLIITVDCGITARDVIAYAMEELGIDFIVTDHHEPPKNIPECIVVDPKVDRKEDCFNELCGAGVVLRLIEAIGGLNAMMYYVDIAALATIADIVPLVRDNRIIVNYGIDIINARARQSMKLLLDLSYPKEPNRIVNSTDIAFKIVPKINAVGRLADSRKAVELFVDDDYFYAKSLVESAIEYNTERQRLTEEVYKDCLYKLENYDFSRRIIVLLGEKWEMGVVGIAAARLATEFNRPAILLVKTEKICKGSCRSIKNIDLYSCLSRCSMYLNEYGGHEMACGLTLIEDNVESFAVAMNEMLQSYEESIFLPNTVYDIEVVADEFDTKLIDDISVIEPFGEGNPEVRYLTVSNKLIRVGTNNHAKIQLNPEGELMAVNAFNSLNNLNGIKEIFYVATAGNNIYSNRRYASGIVQKSLYNADTYDNAEYLAVKHAYQLKSNSNALFSTESIDDKEIQKLLNKCIYGTCFLCYNKDTYNKFAQKHGDRIICRDIGTIQENNPYNRIVMDINVQENLSYYDNIVFLDKPMKKGYIDELLLNRNAKVFVYYEAEIGCSQNIAILKMGFPTVERMREIYMAIKPILTSIAVCSLSELYRLVEKDVKIIEFYIAIFTFFELKILKSIGKIMIDYSVVTSLDKSAIYIGIKKAIDKIN